MVFTICKATGGTSAPVLAWVDLALPFAKLFEHINQQQSESWQAWPFAKPRIQHWSEPWQACLYVVPPL